MWANWWIRSGCPSSCPKFCKASDIYSLVLPPDAWCHATRKRFQNFYVINDLEQSCSGLKEGKWRRSSALRPEAEVKTDIKVVDILVPVRSQDLPDGAKNVFFCWKGRFHRPFSEYCWIVTVLGRKCLSMETRYFSHCNSHYLTFLIMWGICKTTRVRGETGSLLMWWRWWPSSAGNQLCLLYRLAVCTDVHAADRRE